MLSCKNTKETSIACRMLSLTGYLSRTLYIQYWFSTHFALALNPSNESWDHHCAVSSPFLLNFLPRTNKLITNRLLIRKTKEEKEEIGWWNAPEISTDTVQPYCAQHLFRSNQTAARRLVVTSSYKYYYVRSLRRPSMKKKHGGGI